jgi:hypothetical protein
MHITKRPTCETYLGLVARVGVLTHVGHPW